MALEKFNHAIKTPTYLRIFPITIKTMPRAFYQHKLVLDAPLLERRRHLHGLFNRHIRILVAVQ